MSGKQSTDFDIMLAKLRHPTYINNKATPFVGRSIAIAPEKYMVIREAYFSLTKDYQSYTIFFALVRSSGKVIADQVAINCIMYRTDPYVVKFNIGQLDKSPYVEETLTVGYNSKFKSQGLSQEYTSYKSNMVTIIDSLRCGIVSPQALGWVPLGR